MIYTTLFKISHLYQILDVLSRRCQKTLKFLDIESSKGVRDDGDRQVSSKLSSLTSLTELRALEEINLFDTNLSDESLATVLLALENLTHLIRGDFLCDALEWVDYWVKHIHKLIIKSKLQRTLSSTT